MSNTNDIKTAADEIVSKYAIHANPDDMTHCSTRCAILEVEACIEKLESFAHYWDLTNGVWYEIESTILNNILTELKSRIV